MPQTDLLLESTPLGYDLVGTTVDEIPRARQRFITQFLSLRTEDRGSVFVSELAADRIKTNADIVGIVALASAQIIAETQALAQDLYIYRTVLRSFVLETSHRIRLNLTLFTERGTLLSEVVVST